MKTINPPDCNKMATDVMTRVLETAPWLIDAGGAQRRSETTRRALPGIGRGAVADEGAA